MAPVREVTGGEALLARPLLDVTKIELVDYCVEHNLFYVEDPANLNLRFARARLRRAREVLEAEGLNAKRLGMLARRVRRARSALDEMSLRAAQDCLINDKDRIEINISELKNWPEEIAYRTFILGFEALFEPVAGGYGPRMERLEAVFEALWNGEKPFKRTLGGVVFDFKPAKQCLILSPERS
jgi:tRNA(Ile)-lysidine synthase